jgi:hypothetical protein
MWYNVNVIKREREYEPRKVLSVLDTRQRKNFFKRNLKNPLDKLLNLCYNKYVSERDKSPLNISLAATKRHENLVANIFRKR